MNRERAIIAGALIGLAVVAVLVGLIFEFGRHDPSPPSLRDQPNPAIRGEVIYVTPGNCIARIDASGANRREVACLEPMAIVARLDDKTIVYTSNGASWVQRDLPSGQERDFPSLPLSKFAPPMAQQSVLGEFITTDGDGSVYRSGGTDGQRVRIYKCDCPEHRTPQPLLWSPDGQWALLGYGDGGHQELWVIARDGSFAGTLADASFNPSVSWYIAGTGVSPKSEVTPIAR